MKEYNTEIISVGTELLLGHVTNTDSRDISELLSKLGINVRYHTVVGDNPQRLLDCIKIAKSRADIIITTGGLGPTCDDLTKEMLARAFGLPLVEFPEERETLEKYLTTFHKGSSNNYKQVLLPEGCTVFHNTCGTAPGCAFRAQGKIVMMFPGPPKECRAMVQESALPYLRALSDKTIVSHAIRIFGMGEGEVDALFADEMNTMANPTMAPYAKESDCLLQVTAKADTQAQAEAMLQPVMDHVLEKLGDVVYGIDVENLEEAVLSLLQQSGKTLAIAETCTGGELAKRFTDLPGASAAFRGGVTAPSVRGLAPVLNLSPQPSLCETAVSPAVAVQMAEQVRQLLGADIGIAVVGNADRNPSAETDPEATPYGLVYAAMAARDGTWWKEKRNTPLRTPSFIRCNAGNLAFDLVRRYLTDKSLL